MQETAPDRCRQLLYEVFSEYGNNNEHVECLHEMFLSFVRDYRRDDALNEKVISTYSALRNLLRESNEIFKER